MARTRTRTQQQEPPRLRLAPNISVAEELLDSLQIQTVPPGRPATIREELAIPLDTQILTLTLGPPLSWMAHTFTLVGTGTTPATTHERCWFSVPALAGYGAAYIYLWQRRVYYAEPPGMWLDIRWHPERGESVAMAWPRTLSADDHGKALRRGLRRLEAITWLGRPLGSGTYPNAAAFLADLRQVLPPFFQHGRSPSGDAVAEVFPGRRSAHQLRRWARHFCGCPWRELMEAEHARWAHAL
jgi:hypothetical protein